MMLNRDELDKIRQSIRDAELHTSAEIRVCVVKQCKGDPLEAAFRKFHQLKMNATQLHNGVLIYLSPNDHKTAILGDKGINEVAGDNFWDEAVKAMITHFKRDEFAEGICKGVQSVGELIQAHYPISKNDINELSDEVILEE